jgi:hypothetical protein
MTRRSGFVGGLLLFFVAFGFPACDLPDAPDGDPASNLAVLATVVQPGASRTEANVTVVEPPTDPAVEPNDYDRMCRHYCGALVDTLLFNCVASGGSVSACGEQDAVFTVDECFELRCAPKRVTQSLCFKQCDSLAGTYGAACAVSTPANESVCTSSTADHDRACREGCGGGPTN